VSNVNRAVTRTRRAAPREWRPSDLRPALRLAAQHAQAHPPFTVTRRVPKSRAPQGRPAEQFDRWTRYIEQTGARFPNLTPRQFRRWAKRLHAAKAPPKTPVSKPGQKPGTGEGQGKGGRTDPGGPVQPKNPKGKS
jgi:hypothetical protein